VPVENLVVCRCGHDIEQHGPEGCSARRGSERCVCRFSRDAVLDSALNAERDEIRRQWLPERAEGGS